MDNVDKSRDILIVTSKNFGLEVNAERTEYMSLCRNHNAGQSLRMKIADW
jgi:hypothetical protein